MKEPQQTEERPARTPALRNDDPPFHLPEGQNYECVQCGQSCHMFEDIFVEQASEDRLRGLDWRALAVEEARERDPLVPGKSDAKKKILRKCGGTCVFQAENGLCSIHAAYDFETKPQTCQDFPVRYVDTPAGVYVGLSFACTAVLRNAGPAMTTQEADARKAFPKANSRRDCRGAVAFTHRYEISWEAYELIEGALRTVLGVRSEPLGMRLVAQSAMLDLIDRLLRELRSQGAREADSGSVEDVKIVGGVLGRYLPNGDVAPLFALAHRMKGSAALQRAFLGLVTAFRQNLHEKERRPTRIGAALRVMRHYLKHMLKMGRVDLIPLDSTFSYDAFRRLRFDAVEDPEAQEALERYFEHQLFRKDLLTGESVWLGHRLMLMQWALLKWYAVGYAETRGQERIDADCIRESIRALELHYVIHTRFGDLFEKFPTLAMILDGIVRRPTYAASMAGGVV